MRLLKQQANSPLNHFVVTYFEAFQNGALSDAEARRFHQHLADCQRCQDWVEEQEDLIERLRVESSPQLRLSPTATERVQRNLYNRMRRAMILNNAKTFLGAATAVLILAIVVGFCLPEQKIQYSRLSNCHSRIRSRITNLKSFLYRIDAAGFNFNTCSYTR